MRRTARPIVGLVLLLVIGACSSPSSSPTPTPTPTPTPVVSKPPSTEPSPSASESPSPTAGESPSDGPTTSPTPSESPVSGTTYVVRRGDGLAAIARAYGTTVEELQRWNADRYPSLATNPNVIEPGWELVVSLEPGVTPRPTPTLRPTVQPTPPPSASGCSAGNRGAPGSAQTFRTIPGAGAGVALTFDMGGRMEPAADIMRFLVEHEVCATIFATGVMSETPQGREVMAIIREHPGLFEIANHTMYHCDLARGGGGSPTTAPCQTGGPPTADFVRRELAEAEAILRDGTGQNPQPYWRPPYGSINAAVIEAAASAGYTKTFLWDIDTVDWKPIGDGGPTAQQIAAKVVGNAVNGSNVLFHLGGYETLDSLRLIVPALRDRGFTLTSLSDLLH